MIPGTRRGTLWALNQAPLLLFLVTLGVFGWLSPRFFSVSNLANIVVQSSSTAVVAVGMTFVLLTAGVDLSVGAVMFVAGAVAGKLALSGVSFEVLVFVMLALGAAAGLVNALLVTRLGILAFIATLGMLYVGRGFGRWLTETRQVQLPESFLQFGAERVLGLPLPILVLGLVVLTAQGILVGTPFGRQVYAVGHDAEAARKAGVPVRRILILAYVICGLCAAVGGLLSLGQLGAVSPTFGEKKEFLAIAAAVLGGTSLLGGRGQVFPGTLLGAVLMQSVENGLTIVNADPYVYPLVISGIIFLAVVVDSVRGGLLARITRRPVRVEPEER